MYMEGELFENLIIIHSKKNNKKNTTKQTKQTNKGANEIKSLFSCDN